MPPDQAVALRAALTHLIGELVQRRAELDHYLDLVADTRERQHRDCASWRCCANAAGGEHLVRCSGCTHNAIEQQ